MDSFTEEALQTETSTPLRIEDLLEDSRGYPERHRLIHSRLLQLFDISMCDLEKPDLKDTLHFYSTNGLEISVLRVEPYKMTIYSPSEQKKMIVTIDDKKTHDMSPEERQGLVSIYNNNKNAHGEGICRLPIPEKKRYIFKKYANS